MTSSPIVARWELSRRLGARRRELKMGVEVITKALGFTRNYWSAVENDRTLVAEDTLRQLFDVLQFEEPDRTELLELREASRQRGWWDDYSHILSREMKRFYGYEDGASRINAYDSNIIPGLLQTEEYRRSIVRSDPALSELELDDLLAIRRRRQLLLETRRPNVTFLLNEAALRQQISGPEAQAAQLDHITSITTSTEQAIEIRVIPFDTNPGLITQSSTLLIFEFRSAHLPSVVCQEAARVLDFIESGDEQFRRLNHSWNVGLEHSLNDKDSIDLIKNVRASL